MASKDRDFEARRMAERYGPSFLATRRILDGLVLVTLVAVVVGLARWPVLLVVAALRLALPGVFGWLMGRRIGRGDLDEPS